MVFKNSPQSKMKEKSRPHRFTDVSHTGRFNVAGGALRAGRIFNFLVFLRFFEFFPKILIILADSRTLDNTDDVEEKYAAIWEHEFAFLASQNIDLKLLCDFFSSFSKIFFRVDRSMFLIN